ncbi:hypothetical protein FA13DRAFT_943547 [Coprinellus micaceus]|uniref:Uncharacterized protein n=1 Tax=Coprinellus micaceus TaxID=71717 RepID=A0A4Y7RYV9_COPMI|nr:hypothetical protein FA13DRAFT_943547 [Coprinellus micaceus]
MLSWKKVLFTSANLAKNWVHEGGKVGTPSLVETMPYSAYVASLRNLKMFDVSSSVFKTRLQARLSGTPLSMTSSAKSGWGCGEFWVSSVIWERVPCAEVGAESEVEDCERMFQSLLGPAGTLMQTFHTKSKQSIHVSALLNGLKILLVGVGLPLDGR